jgi:methylenetetrahydrofolate reductase (NADPH)
VHRIDDVEDILAIESSFSATDWKSFALEIQYPVEGEFYYYERDDAAGLADARRRTPISRGATHNVTLGYRFSKVVHDSVFTPGTTLNRLGKWVYSHSQNPMQGPRSLRVLEHASKAAMFGCKDCGDCSLPDIAYLCPESQCAKNQRNGPCGGTRDGKCEVHDFECIWSRAYDRAKYEGTEQDLLAHAPVIQDESLRGTSSWANALLGRDHTASSESGGVVASAITSPPVANAVNPTERITDVHRSSGRVQARAVARAEAQAASAVPADR